MIDSSPVAGDARWPLLAYMLTLPPKGLVVTDASKGLSPHAVPPAPEADTGHRADSDELPYGQPVERMRDLATGHRAAQVVSGQVQGGLTA